MSGWNDRVLGAERLAGSCAKAASSGIDSLCHNECMVWCQICQEIADPGLKTQVPVCIKASRADDARAV